MNYAVIVFSYLIGAFPSAYLAGRWLKGVDIRRIGDTNPGAANVGRNISHLAGLAVLAVDAAKGTMVVLVSQAFASQTMVLTCGVAVIAGHNFPVFFRFKGGRGLATAIGVLIALLPLEMAIMIAVCAIPFFKTGNLLLAGAILFVPLPFLEWWMGVPFRVIVYSLALPVSAGIMHLITTRKLSPEEKRAARYMW